MNVPFMGTQPSQPRIAFDAFAFDRAAGELRKHGTRLRLAGQPLQILEMLLDRPGQVVTREDLQQGLWKGTTFVDFEHGLNAAINKLRQALGDSADQPRYIETLPGRGYRFIGAVRPSSKPIFEMVAQPSSEPEPSPEVPPWQSPPQQAPPILKMAGIPRAALIPGIALLSVVALFFGMRFAERRSRSTASPALTTRFRIVVPEGMKLTESQTFSLSPDGRTLVYLATAAGGPLRLWAQSLDSLEPRLLPGTESLGGDPQTFWSPDSKTVVFYSNETLKRADLNGNPPQVICTVPGIVLGGSWNAEGTIIFGSVGGGIMRVPATGGEAVPVTNRDPARVERVHADPTFLPDGRHFVYSRLSSVPENNGVFVGSLDAKPAEQDQRRLVATPFGALFVASPDGNGKLLFQHDTTLWAQDFDTSRRELTGEPALVAEHVGNVRAFGFFAASASGALIHRSGLRDISRLTWFDLRGQKQASVGEPVDLEDSFALSPDGTRIAMAKFDGGNVDVWVHDLARNVSQRLTFDPALDSAPNWSPDGKRIAFSSSRAGHYDLYQIRASGEGREELLYASSESKFASSWSPDGRFLLYSAQTAGTNGDIWALPLDVAGARKPLPLLHTRANERSGKLSPDGRWLAYVSDESGASEVYVQTFAPPLGTGDSPAGPKLLVSRGGGYLPHWRADGAALFYHAFDGTLVSVALQGGGADVKPSAPQALFHLPGLWDAAADGRRFLAAVPEAQAAPPPFTVVLNWQAELKK